LVFDFAGEYGVIRAGEKGHPLECHRQPLGQSAPNT
jgi:hypothetical protein